MRPLRLFLALALAPLCASAQRLEEKVTVNYVEVPVTVVARDGGPVRGLTAANFELRDDGQLRAIDSFDAIDFAAADTAKAISPLNPASRRNFLLLFDLTFSNPNAIVRAQQAARNFIARSIGGRDLVGIGALDIDRGFRLLTAFTTDRELLLAAIADPRNFRSADPLQIASSYLMQQPATQGSSPGEKESIALENMADVARASGRLDEAFNRTRALRQVEMLGQIASSLQRLAGRKHLVLLSEGFDPRLIEGRDVSEVDEQAEENRAVSAGEVWKVDSDKRFGSSGAQQSIAAMSAAFRRADVVLHAVDIKGVRVQNDVRAGAKLSSNGALFMLANATGGTVFRNSNDITSDFDRLTRQHEVVYVLGFHAPFERAGGFHELKVKLVGVPGARVQHRGGYYEAGNETVVERSLSTAEIIVNDIPQDEIGLDALAAPFPTARAEWQVPVVLEISGPDLVKRAQKGVATADVFVYAFDEDGRARDSLYQRMRLDMSQVAAKLQRNGIRFYGTLSLPPGSYAVKTLVRVAESSATGYQRVDVTVPGPGDVAVARPFFFEEPGDWVMVKSTRETPAVSYPFVLDGNPFIPAARVTLRKGEPRLFALFVYNAEQAEATFDVTPPASLVSQTAGEGVTKYVFAIEHPPEDAKELRVVMRRKGSADERTVSVPVRVQ